MKCPICGQDSGSSPVQCGRHVVMTYDNDGNLLTVQDIDGLVWLIGSQIKE